MVNVSICIKLATQIHTTNRDINISIKQKKKKAQVLDFQKLREDNELSS